MIARSERFQKLNEPVDGASLAQFRILFGSLMAVGIARFWWMGWIERSFLEPKFFFKYWGFEWVQVPLPTVIYSLYIVLFLAAVAIALGLFYRASAIVFFLFFTWMELWDASNYLNHYYLASLLSFLLIFLPAQRQWSLDARFGFVKGSREIPFWAIALLRFQFCVVYFFAGLAKATPDWLLNAQPMTSWMSANVDLPLIGVFFTRTWAHYAAAWAGFLYDSLIWIFLLWAPARIWAYFVVILFHGLTHLMFPIGMFPFIMTFGTLIFFSPSWPRRWLAFVRLGTPPWSRIVFEFEKRRIPLPEFASMKLGRPGVALLAVYAVYQIAMPLRNFVLYEGNILWSEEGARWSWRVMTREKNGDVEFRVKEIDSGREWIVPASQYLARHQELEMSGQPDLILQLARHIGREFAEKKIAVEVRADTSVSLNGRPGVPLVDSHLDLLTVEDRLTAKNWITAAPTDLALDRDER
jgi:hypothetical protein